MFAGLDVIYNNILTYNTSTYTDCMCGIAAIFFSSWRVKQCRYERVLGEIARSANIEQPQPRNKELTRGPPELVQHFRL
jgi:hypothetical protein